MISRISSSGQPCCSGEFTFPGKWGAAVLVLAFGLAGPAAARPQSGPTSSVSVGISISVAPQYELKASAPMTPVQDNSDPTHFCLATNGRPTTLPVRLVGPASGSDRAIAEQLDWCGSSDGATRGIGGAKDGRLAGPLLVYPE